MAYTELLLNSDITLKGTLYCREEVDPIFLYEKGELPFSLGSDNSPFPILTGYAVLSQDVFLTAPETKYAYAKSEQSFVVGNINDMKPALAEMFGEKSAINVEVTLTNLNLVFVNTGASKPWSATLKSVKFTARISKPTLCISHTGTI